MLELRALFVEIAETHNCLLLLPLLEARISTGTWTLQYPWKDLRYSQQGPCVVLVEQHVLCTVPRSLHVLARLLRDPQLALFVAYKEGAASDCDNLHQSAPKNFPPLKAYQFSHHSRAYFYYNIRSNKTHQRTFQLHALEISAWFSLRLHFRRQTATA